MGGQASGFTGNAQTGYSFGGNADVNNMLGMYAAPVPVELQRLGQSSSAEMARAQGAQDMPTFADMFNRYLDVSNREAARSAAQINEAMGSRGARYGSDLTRAQSDLRQRQTQDIQNMAGQFTLGLENSRQGLLNLAGQGLSNVGGANMASWQSGLGMMRQDAAAAGAPGPLFGPAAAWGAQWGPGDTVAM